VPGFPLPLRNALAALAIEALDDAGAAEALAWLAAPAGPVPDAAADRLAALHLVDPGAAALLAVHAPHTEAAAAHARRALAARAAHSAASHGADGPVARAVRQAIALWNAHLFFEVHEVLEAVWKTAVGNPRQALQGLIQVAVAYHHVGHANVRGARTLMQEGRARLASVAPGTLAPLDVAALLAATAAWDTLRPGDAPPPGDPPALRAG